VNGSVRRRVVTMMTHRSLPLFQRTLHTLPGQVPPPLPPIAATPRRTNARTQADIDDARSSMRMIHRTGFACHAVPVVIAVVGAGFQNPSLGLLALSLQYAFQMIGGEIRLWQRAEADLSAELSVEEHKLREMAKMKLAADISAEAIVALNTMKQKY